jgi:hypothetical protein
MDNVQISNYELFTRADGFGVERAADFPASSLGGQTFISLRALIAELEQKGTAQTLSKGAAKTSTQAKKIGRENLRGKMVAVSETARTMESSFPGISASFRVPYTNGDQALLSAARAFVETATPLKAEFIKREMPADFLEDLIAAINAFESACDNQNLHKEKRVAATAAIDALIEQGKELVRQLDAIVRNKYRNDPATIAAWESATHVPRTARKKKTTPTTAPTT